MGHNTATETRYDTLDAAKTACSDMPECTMLYSDGGITDTFYICPPTSTTETFTGHTLYTKGKILKCKITKWALI